MPTPRLVGRYRLASGEGGHDGTREERCLAGHLRPTLRTDHHIHGPISQTSAFTPTPPCARACTGCDRRLRRLRPAHSSLGRVMRVGKVAENKSKSVFRKQTAKYNIKFIFFGYNIVAHGDVHDPARESACARPSGRKMNYKYIKHVPSTSPVLRRSPPH